MPNDVERKEIHNSLRDWLVDLGKSVKDKSGRRYYEKSEAEKVLDIRIGSVHFEYRPDVVWERQAREVIFEIALSEDWRAIVGECVSASKVHGIWKLFIITQGWTEEFLSKLEKGLTNELPNIDYGVTMILIPKNIFKGGKLKDMKEFISKTLTKLRWVS